MILGSVLVLLSTFVVAGVLWSYLLQPMRDDLKQAQIFMRDLTQVFVEVPALIQYLSHDLHTLTARQDALLEEVIRLLERAADRAFFTANRVADNLADREEKVDAATDVVATNLADAQTRADEATGEPGAAADAAALPPPRDPE